MMRRLPTTIHTPSSPDPELIARWLFGLSTLGIIYGSLYPFNISPADIGWVDAISRVMSHWEGQLGWPNIFANVVLFVPYGLFGLLSVRARVSPAHWIVLFTSAAVIALALQFAQLWLAARNPTVVDALINLVGAAIGAGIAQAPIARQLLGRWRTDTHHLTTLPALLMLAWLGYQWFPFVPTLDVQAIKDGLKPLVLDPQLRLLNLLHNLTAWLVFAALWHQCRLRTDLLWLAIPLAVLARAAIADNPLHLHNVLAAVLAPAVWTLLLRSPIHSCKAVLGLLMIMLVIQGLRPFELSTSQFRWVPFTGFLTGNMMINTQSLLEKLFLYGALVWLTLLATERRSISLILPVTLTLLIELLQTRIAGRVAEITDPLLCVLLWFLATRTVATRWNGVIASASRVDGPSRSLS